MMNSSIPFFGSIRLLSLPDDCIQLIFERTPLEDQFRLRSLCHRICLIIECWIFRQQHSLKLTHTIGQKIESVHYPARNLFSNRPQLLPKKDDPPGLFSSFQHDVLVCPEYDGAPVPTQIGTLLPNVRHLVAFKSTNRKCTDERTVNFYLELLPSWSNSLVSLTLFCVFYSESRYNIHRVAFDRLCVATGKLVALRELHLLDIYFWIPPFELMAQTLARLEQLTLHMLLYTWSRTDRSELRHLRPRFRHLRLYVERFCTELNSDPLAELCPQFEQTLTHLSYGSDTFHTDALAQLDALTFLDLTCVRDTDCCMITNPDLFVKLSYKVALVELRVNILLMRNYFRNHTSRDPDWPRPPLHHFPQLIALRCLYLRGRESDFCNTKSFSTQWYTLLGRMFPSLVILNIVKYCTRQEGLPPDCGNKFRATMEQLFRPHFDIGNHIQLCVHFELNRNVLDYYGPNMDSDDCAREPKRFKASQTPRPNHQTKQVLPKNCSIC